VRYRNAQCIAISIAVSLIVGCGDQPDSSRKLETKPRIIFHDDAQCLAEASIEPDPEQYIRDFVMREINAAPITTFVMQAALPDTCIYESKVGYVYGDLTAEENWRWYVKAIRALRAKNTDVLKVVIDQLRPTGVEILAAVRMNDTHHKLLDHKDPSVPLIAVEHPEYVIKQPDGRTNETALDYSHPEVRKYRLAIIREIVEEYDVDGIELNFCRWAKHFPPSR